MIKKYLEFVNEDVYHGGYYDKPKQKNTTPIDSYDDAYDVFTQNILPNYSYEQIPTESYENLRDYILELYDDGEIKTIGDMIDSVNSCIELGWTKSRFYDI